MKASRHPRIRKAALGFLPSEDSFGILVSEGGRRDMAALNVDRFPYQNIATVGDGSSSARS